MEWARSCDVLVMVYMVACPNIQMYILWHFQVSRSEIGMRL